MKATIPVPLQSGTRILHLRADTLSKCYILWLHHNPDYTLGTYLECVGTVRYTTSRYVLMQVRSVSVFTEILILFLLV